MSENTTSTWRERLTSPLTWHYVVFSVLLVGVIALSVRFGLDWAAISSHTHDAILDKQIQLHALKAETEPLRGLDKRLDLTRDQIKQFHAKRIPANYSTIAAQIGNLEVASGVRPSSIHYAQRPAGDNLTEIVLDAGITGEYPQIMKFINSLERDKIFFVITGMSLTGQQAGMVNLRLQVSTWLRPSDAAASGLPSVNQAAQNSAGPQAESTAEEGQPR